MESNDNISSLNLFKGKKVFGNSGNECGVIKDFLLDIDRLNVRFIIISEGNVSNNHYFIAPFGAITFDNPYAAQQTLNMPVEKLLRVPHLPKENNPEDLVAFSEKIMTYYGIENSTAPYRQPSQPYEGSSQITDNIPPNNNAMRDEVAYDRINEKKKEGE